MKTKNYFKLLAMMTMAFVCVCFASCGSDDDDDNNNGGGHPNELVGIWAQFHKEEAFVGYYYGIKLDANGDAAYTEWSYGKTPNWNYTGGGKWSVKDNVLTITAPNGSVAYSSFFTLSSDGNTISLSGDTTEGHFSTLEGDFVKQ